MGVVVSVFLAPLQSLWNVSIDCQCLSQDLTQHFFMVSCGQEGKDWTEMLSISKKKQLLLRSKLCVLDNVCQSVLYWGIVWMQDVAA